MIAGFEWPASHAFIPQQRTYLSDFIERRGIEIARFHRKTLLKTTDTRDNIKEECK
jgi:hypothetical protein